MKTFKYLMPAAMLLAATSCTVDEPQLAEGNADEFRLSSIMSYGVTMMQWTYDAQGRIKSINLENEETYEFDYQGSSSVPNSVVYTEYSTYWVGDKNEKVATNQELWSNIRANASGLITGYDWEDVRYSYRTEYDYETDTETLVKEQYSDFYSTSLDYNAYHQLVKIVDNEISTTSGYGSGSSVRTLTWQDGLLTFVTDDDDYNRETQEYEYSDVANTLGQWDPMNQVMGPIATTGFFGVAPANFFRMETTRIGGNVDEVKQFAYTLMPNGLIRMAKVTDYGETLVLTYNYQKK